MEACKSNGDKRGEERKELTCPLMCACHARNLRNFFIGCYGCYVMLCKVLHVSSQRCHFTFPFVCVRGKSRNVVVTSFLCHDLVLLGNSILISVLKVFEIPFVLFKTDKEAHWQKRRSFL